MSGHLEGISSERRVGDVVAEDYRRAAVFKVFGIDFCCGGDETVSVACDKAEVDYADVAAALSEVGRERGAPDAASADLEELVTHVVEVHHGYVRASVPVLRAFTTKVARVHGDRDPELNEIRDLVEELATELVRHMDEEEEELFPGIVALKNAGPAATPDSVRSTTQPLEDDHDRAGTLMGRIRALSHGFRPPAGACATYRATYAKLAEFEDDLHRHVHLENHVLFPRAASFEEERSVSADPA
jgi:regulator of cell morphogenesis and NO signaling